MKSQLPLIDFLKLRGTAQCFTNPLQLLIAKFYQLRLLLPSRKKFWQLVLGFISGLCLVLVCGWQQLPVVAQITQATITEILDGNQVFIQNKPVRVNAVARLGQTISTKQSRANLVFSNRAGVRLGQNSALTIGSRCVQLQSGRTVVSGTRGCVGSITAVTRGTIYLMEKDENNQAQIKLLEGEIEVTPQDRLEPEPVLLRPGQKIDIGPDGALGAVEQLSQDEVKDILNGVLFEGFDVELPGMNKLKDALNDLFPDIELPGILRPRLPRILRRILPF
ncbi:MAG TPA: hypothetical protein DDZ80_26655 [Cyanobacteria bacterium UBA8803]|nr:hypothetical protein [Cyanobacteria bacterium UBA9273]HBL61860.1 hypothetical protein [Cyanobacteria bacterium UBA8803]